MVDWPRPLDDVFTVYKKDEAAMYDSKKVVFTLYVQVLCQPPY
jgi:hypothetical protein